MKIKPATNAKKGSVQATRSKPSGGGAGKITLPYLAIKALTICCSFIPCFSLLAISSRKGVADPQFSIGQVDTWLLHEPHWHANLSATCLTSGVIISAGKDELNRNSINKAAPEALPRRHMKGHLMFCLSNEVKLNEPLLPLAKNVVVGGRGFLQCGGLTPLSLALA